MRRIIRLLAVGLLAVLAQSLLATLFPVTEALPDLTIPAVLFAATVELDVTAALLPTLATGYAFDLAAGVPAGVHALAFPLLYLTGRWARRRFYLAGVLFEAGASFGGVLLVAAVTVLARIAFQDDLRLGDQLGIGLTVLLRAVLTAAAAPAVFWAARAVFAGRRSSFSGR